MEGRLTKFKRALRAEALLGLEKLTSSRGDNWWKELLRHWTPSGGGDGLRLAVRFNTLDFYFKGHCVAHIGFAPGKRGEPASPHMKCHVRYIFGDKIPGQQQASFDAEEGVWSYGQLTQMRSLNEILNYIRMWKGETTPTGKRRKASEKAGVDAIVGNNKNVIDLEMALPAWKDSQSPLRMDSALRMDIVSLERTENGIQIAFWEAKTFDDSRLRSEATPEVIDQLLGKVGRPGYVDYLRVNDHEVNIRDAYIRTCFILNKLHHMKGAVTCGGAVTSSLHTLVLEVAQLANLPEGEIAERLSVRPQPGLVIYSDGGRVINEDKSWFGHEYAIKAAGIEVLIEQESKSIVLPECAPYR
jgi:hypothetical protein